MFNIGGGELLVIALLALIILGPQRLPGAARQAGKVMADLRRISSGFQNEITSALNDAEVKAATSPTSGPLAPATPVTTPIAAAIDSVSAQGTETAAAPAKTAAAKRPVTKKPAAKKRAPTKKPAVKQPAAKKAPAKAATPAKRPAKKASTGASAVPTPARRRSTT